MKTTKEVEAILMVQVSITRLKAALAHISTVYNNEMNKHEPMSDAAVSLNDIRMSLGGHIYGLEQRLKELLDDKAKE